MLSVSGQKLDSLLRVLHSYKKDDSIKLSLLNQVSQQYLLSNYVLAQKVADTAIMLGTKLDSRVGLARAYMTKGQALNFYGDRTQALVFMQLSLDRFEQLGYKQELAPCLTAMGDIYLNLNDNDKALSYYNKSLVLYEQLADKSGRAKNYLNSGSAYKGLRNMPKALEMYQKAAAIWKENGDIKRLAGAIYGVGTVYSIMGEYPIALTYFEQSLQLSGQNGVTQYVLANLTGFAFIYINLSNFQKALEYHEKALVIMRTLRTKDSSVMLSSIAEDYAGLKQTDKAEKYYLQSIKTSEQLGNPANPSMLSNFGNLYSDLSNFAQAWAIFKKGLVIAQKQDDKKALGLIQISMGHWCDNAPDSMLRKVGIDPVNRYTNTLAYLNKGRVLSEEVGHTLNQRFAWQYLSITHERNREYAKALEAYKRYIGLRDSIENNQNEKKVARLVMQYEFDKQSDSMKLVEQVTSGKLEKQVLLATQQQQEILLGKNRLELRNKELELSNKETDLQHLAFLSTQSSLENEQLEKQGKIKQLTLSENEKQLQAARVQSLTQEKTLNELKREQQFIYLLIGLGMLSFIVLYFFYRARLQRIRLRNEITTEKMLQEQKESEFQRQLGEISMSALRSQMNPHFIFNCLNSIKHFTEENNTTAASEYLSKFSKLIRLALENSRVDSILLSAELTALSLYMDMEAMRFKEKLKYSIRVDQNVDADYIKIPPMLLQPYVENAIWHGLMQKKEGGKIDITVGLEESESIVVVNITDNGIGRTKSELLKSKTATKHKSFGMKVTSERLALINTKYKTGANVTITDIFDNDGAPAGTTVTIKIPIE